MTSMNAAEVIALIEQGETLTTEFKSDVNDTELIEAIVCLANASGGVVVIGVGDDGTLRGASARHGDTTIPERLEALIANQTSPAVVVTTRVVSVEGVELVVVEVPKATSVTATSKGRFLRRALDLVGHPQCLPMSPADVLGRSTELGGFDVSARPLMMASMADLDPVELDRFRRLAKTSGDGVLAELSDSDLVAALGLIDPDGRLRLAALLLFGHTAALEHLVPTHQVAFQVLEGLEVRVNWSQRAPLVRTLVELHAAIAPYNPEEEIQDGLFRIGIPRFVQVSLRELLANALVHRDYAVNGSILVQIEDGALSISNPGGFPDGITVNNILVAPPRPRNPLLADVFKRAGLVERTGRGVNRVFQEQLAIGRSAPDYRRSTATWIQVRLHAGPADRELAAYVAESRRDGRMLRLPDLMILHEVRREGRLTTTQVAELLEVEADEARVVVNEMVERGILESRGERKGRTYHLSAALYRRLGDPGAYVRTRGFDAIQQQQMILTFVGRHGSISRKEAADLCQLDPNAASTVLRGLRDEGRLVMEGSRRGSRYRLASGAQDAN